MNALEILRKFEDKVALLKNWHGVGAASPEEYTRQFINVQLWEMGLLNAQLMIALSRPPVMLQNVAGDGEPPNLKPGAFIRKDT